MQQKAYAAFQTFTARFLKGLQFTNVLRHGGLKTTGLDNSEDTANNARSLMVSGICTCPFSGPESHLGPSISWLKPRFFTQAISRQHIPAWPIWHSSFPRGGNTGQLHCAAINGLHINILINCAFHVCLPFTIYSTSYQSSPLFVSAATPLVQVFIILPFNNLLTN